MNPKGKKLFLIISGVGKAGTTSLFHYLSQHPDICSSDVKEVGYFSNIRYPDSKLPAYASYLQHFSSCSEAPVYLDASPGYYPGAEVTARRIYKHLPDARIIIVFREPLKRLFSFYNYYKSRLELSREITFEDYIQACMSIPEEEIFLPENRVFRGVYESCYAKFLPGWLRIFPEEQIKILFFINLFSDIKSSLADICQWVNIPFENYLENVNISRENKTMLYRFKFLQEFSLSINKIGEAFWRKYSTLKNKLRSVYFFLNGLSPTEQISVDTEQRLQEMFLPYNNKLKIQLQDIGVKNLPDWLET